MLRNFVRHALLPSGETFKPNSFSARCTRQGVPHDDAQAFAWFRKAAEQGNAQAQFNLGVMYGLGQGVPHDDTQAVAWFLKAAEQGNAYAQTNLGVMYKDGRGVAPDDARAVAWYSKAAEQKDAVAQYGLGVMYREGRGVAQDDAEAAQWFRKAAEQGNLTPNLISASCTRKAGALRKTTQKRSNGTARLLSRETPTAQSSLGFMYAEGRGVRRDYTQAVAWFRKAADQGNGNAQCNLGLAYRYGQAVARDDAQAVAWFRKAADQGHDGAQEELRKMEASGLVK